MDGMTDVIESTREARNPRMKRFFCTMAAASLALVVSIAPVKGGEGPGGECGFCTSVFANDCPDEPAGNQYLGGECQVHCGAETLPDECIETPNPQCGSEEAYITCVDNEL